MRWLNVRRVRHVLRKGGLTYESSKNIEAVKGLDFVLYLRARRYAVEIPRGRFISHAVKGRSWLRSQHLKRKRFGLRPIKII
jgi:hypothetical protein